MLSMRCYGAAITAATVGTVSHPLGFAAVAPVPYLTSRHFTTNNTSLSGLRHVQLSTLAVAIGGNIHAHTSRNDQLSATK